MKSISKNLYEALLYAKENPQLSKTSIAQKFNVDRHSIKESDLENYQFFDNEKYYWITEEEQQPVLYFLNHIDESLTAVAKKFHTKPSTIVRRMQAMGYCYETRYKRKFNRNAFSGQPNEEMAYWLGFLLADGYINEERGFLKIKLGIADKNHIIKFGNFIGETDIEDKLQYEIGGAYNKNNSCVSTEFDSGKLINDLKKYNLFQNKSGKEVPYNFNDAQLQKAYVRGMIDGDGHIEKNRIKYVGSLQSCEYIKNYFGKFINYNQNSEYIYQYGNIFTFQLNRQEVTRIIENLYKDATIYLDRKYAIAVPKTRN